MKTTIALLLLAALQAEHRGPHPKPVELTVDFRVDIDPGAGLAIQVEHLWDDTYRLTYKAHRSAPDGWRESGEVLLHGHGNVMLAVADDVQINAPTTVAVLPVREEWRLAGR